MHRNGLMPPGGFIQHTAGSTESGWRVVDVWEEIGTFERFSREQIGPERAVRREDRPEEVVWHVHGAHDDGYLVIDTWTSREARERFIEQRVRPAIMQEADVGSPPAIEEMEIVGTMSGAAAATAG